MGGHLAGQLDNWAVESGQLNTGHWTLDNWTVDIWVVDKHWPGMGMDEYKMDEQHRTGALGNGFHKSSLMIMMLTIMVMLLISVKMRMMVGMKKVAAFFPGKGVTQDKAGLMGGNTLRHLFKTFPEIIFSWKPSTNRRK